MIVGRAVHACINWIGDRDQYWIGDPPGDDWQYGWIGDHRPNDRWI